VASNATLAKEIKELKAKLMELEAALKRKMKATTAAPKKENKAEVQQYASCWEVRVVAAAAPDCRAHAALRTEHLACNRKKTCYDCLADSMGLQQGDRAWLYHPTQIRGKSPKLQSSWEGQNKVITQINNVGYRIRQHSRAM
jgi:hypothetical protein